ILVLLLSAARSICRQTTTCLAVFGGAQSIDSQPPRARGQTPTAPGCGLAIRALKSSHATQSRADLVVDGGADVRPAVRPAARAAGAEEGSHRGQRVELQVPRAPAGRLRHL